MKIGEKINFVDRCVLLTLEEKKILVVGDLHIGKENLMMERGAVFPKTQMEESTKIFKEIFKKTGEIDEIVLLGDVKDHFGGVLRDEFLDFWKLMDLFRRNLKKREGSKIIIVKGNHDSILEPIVRDYSDVILKDYYLYEDFLFLHGHHKGFENVKKKIDFYDKKIKKVIMGHFHTAIRVEDSSGIKSELFKCFLAGRDRKMKKDLLFVPSFFPLSVGKDILTNTNKGKANGFDIKNFEVFVVFEDRKLNVRSFGKVKDFFK